MKMKITISCLLILHSFQVGGVNSTITLRLRHSRPSNCRS